MLYPEARKIPTDNHFQARILCRFFLKIYFISFTSSSRQAKWRRNPLTTIALYILTATFTCECVFFFRIIFYSCQVSSLKSFRSFRFNELEREARRWQTFFHLFRNLHGFFAMARASLLNDSLTWKNLSEKTRIESIEPLVTISRIISQLVKNCATFGVGRIIHLRVKQIKRSLANKASVR